MPVNDPTFVEDLVGYQLGICDEQQRWAVESRLGTSPEARSTADSLKRVLHPLNTYQVLPPATLVDNILTRVQQPQSIFKFPAKGKATVEATDAAPGGGRPVLAMRELLSLAAAIVLFVGVFVPGYQAARNNASKGLCMEQMRVLGQALNSYADSNNGMLPYSPASMLSGNIVGTASLPKASGNLQALQAGNYVPGQRSLACPGDPRVANGANVYNVQVFVVPQSIRQLVPYSPIISDPNPLVHDGRYLPIDALRNSDAHGNNAGQNVLRLNGTAGWNDRPTVGVDGDDIFRVNDPRTYAREPSRALSDAFLTP